MMPIIIIRKRNRIRPRYYKRRKGIYRVQGGRCCRMMQGKGFGDDLLKEIALPFRAFGKMLGIG